MHLIAWSIPVFLAAIAIELVIARRRRRDAYRFSVAVADISCGVTQQLFNLLTFAAVVVLYVMVFEHRVVELDPGAATTWLFGMVGVDFFYYWWHRASHEVSFLWASHAVHHQSEDYNLAVALRQALFTSASQLVFALPLALLGLPPAVYLVCRALNSLYQFWIHTELIGKLGPVEEVLNTPSHHRVHHAINPRYLDKNYGGILITWDRLFGSFEREGEAPVYGTTKQLHSLNPLWANFEHLVEIGRRVREGATLRERLRAIFGSPNWRPGAYAPMTAGELRARAARRFDVPLSPALLRYVLVQMALVVPLTMAVLIAGKNWQPGPLVLFCVALGAGTVAFAGLAERRRWAWPLEGARLAALVVSLALVTGRI